jgi:hypothetical protein
MNNLLLFVVQIGVPVMLGIGATIYLRGVTHNLLADICGTEERAEFWVRITTVLTTAMPLVLVLLFGYTQNNAMDFWDTAYAILRQTLWLSLIGILAAVAALARTIWKQIPRLQTESSATMQSVTGE